MTPEILSSIVGAWLNDVTMSRLTSFAQLVTQWNTKINLISPATLPEIWTRHIADSAQLYRLLPERASRLVDIGSGAGFPGIVMAIILASSERDMKIDLIESDRRKAAFLAVALRELRLHASIHARRADEVGPLRADVVTARALAPLHQLMPLAMRHLDQDGICIFPKGRRYREELALSSASGLVRDIVQSRIDPESAILVIGRSGHAEVR